MENQVLESSAEDNAKVKMKNNLARIVERKKKEHVRKLKWKGKE
jgi:hypothetical protein